MQKRDIQKFLDLRSKLWDEYHALEAKIDDLDEQRQTLSAEFDRLTNILNGYTTTLEDESVQTPNVGDPDSREQIDAAVVRFLTDHIDASRKELREALAQFEPDVAKKLERSLKRLKGRGVIVRSGNTRNSTWSLP